MGTLTAETQTMLTPRAVAKGGGQGEPFPLLAKTECPAGFASNTQCLLASKFLTVAVPNLGAKNAPECRILYNDKKINKTFRRPRPWGPSRWERTPSRTYPVPPPAQCRCHSASFRLATDLPTAIPIKIAYGSVSIPR